jgi:phosphoribosyl 1,2-cyclic phosphodiesterase
MSVVKVVGTGSNGNCYAIVAKCEKLIIECGMKLIDIKKKLDFDISDIVGCLISHSHLD